MTETPANWYPDPLGRHEHRYWDGARWTDHVASAGRTAVDPIDSPRSAVVDEGWEPDGGAWGTAGWHPDGEAPDRAPAGGAPRTNTKALASLILSIAAFPLGFVLVGVLAAIAGMVLGFVARREIAASHGRETGAGMALAGILIGAAVVVLTIVIVAVLLAVLPASVQFETSSAAAVLA